MFFCEIGYCTEYNKPIINIQGEGKLAYAKYTKKKTCSYVLQAIDRCPWIWPKDQISML